MFLSLRWDRPDTSVVNISEIWTQALETAEGMPTARKKVLLLTP